MKLSVKVLVIALLSGIVSMVAVLPVSAAYNFSLDCDSDPIQILVGGTNSGDTDTPVVAFKANGVTVANSIIKAHSSSGPIFAVAAGTTVTATIDGSSKVYHCPGSGSSAAVVESEALTCEQLIADNRLNVHDCAAPVAIYTGSLEIYSIDQETGEGVLDLRLSDDTMNDPTVPEVNMLLAEAISSSTGHPIQIWRLSTGEFALHTLNPDGSAYNYVWTHIADA